MKEKKREQLGDKEHWFIVARCNKYENINKILQKVYKKNKSFSTR